MPGYNHYPDCTCGWCVKTGGNYVDYIDRNHLRRKMAEDTATRQLRDHGVREFLSACFVIPNARCPVCGQQVYYYQNEFGSRVFFDDLGPPWPKHPCTDNPRGRWTPSKLTSEMPSPRKRGISLELVEAASVLGKYVDRQFRPDGFTEHWTPIEVISVDRDDKRDKWRIGVKAKYLESPELETFWFTYVSPQDQIGPGSIIHKRGNEISLFDLAKMKSRLYKIEIVNKFKPI